MSIILSKYCHVFQLSCSVRLFVVLLVTKFEGVGVGGGGGGGG